MTTITQMLINGQNDLYWFESHLESLRLKYNNEFIAFHDKRIIEHDHRLDNLMKRLKDKNIDISHIFIKFVSKVKSIL